jgi:hypothetical protein
MHTNPYNLLFPWIPLSHPTSFHPSSESLEAIWMSYYLGTPWAYGFWWWLFPFSQILQACWGSQLISATYVGRGAACYIMWTCITQPILRWKREKAHRSKSSGIRCPCNCSIEITHKAHSYHRSATLSSPKSAKTQTQNQHSFSYSSSLLSPNFLHWLVIPIPVRHHIKSHSL